MAYIPSRGCPPPFVSHFRHKTSNKEPNSIPPPLNKISFPKDWEVKEAAYLLLILAATTTRLLLYPLLHTIIGSKRSTQQRGEKEAQEVKRKIKTCVLLILLVVLLKIFGVRLLHRGVKLLEVKETKQNKT